MSRIWMVSALSCALLACSAPPRPALAVGAVLDEGDSVQGTGATPEAPGGDLIASVAQPQGEATPQAAGGNLASGFFDAASSWGSSLRRGFTGNVVTLDD